MNDVDVNFFERVQKVIFENMRICENDRSSSNNSSKCKNNCCKNDSVIDDEMSIEESVIDENKFV
jgi:NDP-sugar pyrophosphorylase family protein